MVLQKHFFLIYTVGDDMKKKRKSRYRQTGVPKTKEYYETIDGNWTNHPVAFCHRYHGALTRGLMHTHKCCDIGCKRLNKNYKFE